MLASHKTPPVLLMAEARMAVQYLERAETWAAGVDQGIVADLALIHRRLQDRIDSLWRLEPQ